MWPMGDGGSWWMAMGWLGMAGFWGLIIWAVYALMTRLPHKSSDQDSPHKPTALEILERRYARGDIGVERFEEMRRRLTSGSGPTSRVA